MKTFHLKIYTPTKQFFNGDVVQIIIETSDGELGILADREPAVIAIVAGVIKLQMQDGSWKTSAGGEGVLQVMKSSVTLLSYTMEWAEDLETARINREIERAEERLRQQRSISEYKMGKLELARAFAKLKAKSKL